jgi:hypothetical protein
MLLTFLCLLIASVTVEVETTEGKKISGTIESIDAQSIEVSGHSPIPIDSASAIQFPEIEVRDAAELRIQLANDSLLAARQVTFDGNKVTVNLARQPDLIINSSDVVAIRFRPESPKTDATWLGLLQQESASDRMVIRREGEQLDSIEGVIESIGEKNVKFSIDGDQVDAQWSRLEGVLFRREKSERSPDPILVQDGYGGRWRAQSIATTNDGLQLKSGDISHLIPLDQIQVIRFGGSNQMLVESERASQTLAIPFGLKVPKEFAESLLLGSKPATQQLDLPAGGKIEFRVPEGMNRLVGSVSRAPEISRGGKVTVMFRDGEKTLWQTTISDATRHGFDIKLDGVRRVEMVVDDAGDGDLGDRVRIDRAKFVR